MAGFKLISQSLPFFGVMTITRRIDRTDVYTVEVERCSDIWAPKMSDAIFLGRCIRKTENLFRIAGQKNEPARTGPTYVSYNPDGSIGLQIGIVDDSAIGAQFCSLPPVRLPGTDGDLLLTCLMRLSEDAFTMKMGAGSRPASDFAADFLRQRHAELDRRLESEWIRSP